MIVFTGSGRCGTKLYSKLFDTHHEYNVSGLIGQLRALPQYYNPPTDLLADIQLRRKIMRSHLSGVDKAIFRDSSNPCVHFLDALFEIDHDIRIVLCTRDGRGFARSGITRGYHLPDGIRHFGSLKTIIRATRRICGYPLPDRYASFGRQPEQDDPWFTEWPRMSPVERMAWLWQYRYEKALTRLASVPRTNWTLVRLEDLTGDPARGNSELKRLEGFLGVESRREALTQKHNASKKFGFPDKGQWTESDVSGFFRIAGSTMEKLGYGSKPLAACA